MAPHNAEVFQLAHAIVRFRANIWTWVGPISAYWVKGRSSLGRLRYAVLLDVDGGVIEGDDLCLNDVKEGVKAAAPRYTIAAMPKDNAERVVEGAHHLSPYLGERMRATQLQDKPVTLRELLPQDLKLEIEQISEAEAMKVARYLALAVGRAHARQMDGAARKAWLGELQRNKTNRLTRRCGYGAVWLS